MRECLIILSILACSSVALANSNTNKTHHCCTPIQRVDAKANVTKVASHSAAQGMPERARRSITGDRDTRTKFTKALLDTSSKEFLPARGRRSKFQKLKDLSSAEDPFWAARGRRAYDASNEDPFWAARGKKLLLDSSLESADPFWAARGKKLIDSSDEKDDPFWAARGKKLLLENSVESADPFWVARGKKLIDSSDEKDDPFWAARGKKLIEESSHEDPFWAARGKKLLSQSASAEDPFWAARGKKLLEASAENPFWAARGKKLLLESSGEDPFWAARGKKLLTNSAENPFWAARGKKMLESASAENPFYAPRGRRSEKSKEDSKENPFYAPRGKREDPKVIDGSKELGGVLKPRANRQPGEEFWPARGKRPLASSANNLQNFWLNEARKESLSSPDDEDDDSFWERLFGIDESSGENVSDVVAQILGISTNNQKIKKHMGRQAPIVNPRYSTDFWATRG